MKNIFKVDQNHEIRLVNGEWLVFKDGVSLNEVPPKLTKYYPLSENSLNSIEIGYFHLQNPKNFNDPFDCCANLIIEQQVKDISGMPEPIINDLPDIGVSCFSTKDVEPLMWAHYTKSYCGFALTIETEFKTAILPEFKSHMLSRVIYTDNPNPASEKQPFSGQYRLITKLKNWEYENEWRLIVHKKEDSDFNRFYFSKQSVKEILIGFKLNPRMNPSLSELQNRFWSIIKKNYPGVPIYHVSPSKDSFELRKIRMFFAEDYFDLD